MTFKLPQSGAGSSAEKTPVDPARVAAFAAGADAPKEKLAREKSSRPWEKVETGRRIPRFPVYLNDRELAMLDFLVDDKAARSKQAFCLAAIQRFIELEMAARGQVVSFAAEKD